ncbi:uncharacterized protein LOC134204020 [Armigeres subalbatus]|uniref:uncharacterized protein LOC134204020 n=1 Tax=Armigeres subalbatus TaxID=124917 RepID=UPI002ED6BC1F
MERNSINSRKTRGGGVLIAVASNLSCSIDPAPVSNKLEQIWVKIKLQSNFVSIGVLYLPPDRRDDQSLIQQHIESIDSVVSNLNQSDIVIQLGDYNHPELHWTRSEEGGFKLDASRSRLTTAGSLLFDGFCFHGLTQMNSVLNCNSKILDLVMVNDQGLLTSVFETIDSLVQVDAHHPALVIAVPVSLPTLYEPSLDNTRMQVSASQIDAAIQDAPANSFDFHLDVISDEQVLCALRKLKYSVSSGPDGIPSAVLKKCSITLITPLVKLFNISLRRGVFPTNWKVSFMSPIYKKGDKCSIANYRGIHITVCLL